MKIFFVTTLAIILMSTILFAQAPNTIMYQGKLTNADGTPLTSVDSVHFFINSVETDIGTILYDTAVTDLAIDANGVFTIELGPVGSTVFTGAKRYLGIKVNSDDEMTPRQLLTSAPYSMATAMPPGIAHTFQNVNATLGTSTTLIDSVMITVPSAGHIVYQAAGAVELRVTTTGSVKTIISLSASRSSMDYRNMTNFDLGIQAPDYYYTPISIIVVDNVPSAGTYKYYLVGTKSSGVTTAVAYRCHILATFYPTSYGTVEESKANNRINSASPDGAIRDEQETRGEANEN